VVTVGVIDLVADRVRVAITESFGARAGQVDPELRTTTRAEFGHLQTNVSLRLAGMLGLTPLDVAQRIAAAMRVEDLCDVPEVAGPGFINFTILPAVLAQRVTAMLSDPRLGVAPLSPSQTVVVDFSSPNLAKEMHVGHLRSTVIGDCLARVLEYCGHAVIRQNHVGDWGTPFGMLIEGLIAAGSNGEGLSPADLTDRYKTAHELFKSDPVFRDQARSRVVAMQSGDEETLLIWRRLVATSTAANQSTYERMGVGLSSADLAGESAYNEQLPTVVADLATAGLLTDSTGARCVFLPGFVRPDGSPLPLIVQKADGSFGYDATDLAALRRRVDGLRADRLVYVVDARQSLHFDQLFAVARAAGWLPDDVTAEHVAFGAVLGKDGKPLKTRDGDPVPLTSLLDAADAKAIQLLHARKSALSGAERTHAARSIGLAAIKYADLGSGLGKDYTFSLDRMLSTDGNTGPYLQYAHARASTLLSKAGGNLPGTVTTLTVPAEQQLALKLGGFADAIHSVAASLEPHRLCSYLYDLATSFSTFYDRKDCQVLRAEGGTRDSRLALTLATKRVLSTGLGLLGIDALDAM
jgi:arginyl-tRNA synthetase